RRPGTLIGTTRRHQLRLLVAAEHFGFITAKRHQAGGAAGLTATFEIVGADKAGVIGWKRRPICGGRRSLPYHPFGTLAARSTLAIPTAQGGKGAVGRAALGAKRGDWAEPRT